MIQLTKEFQLTEDWYPELEKLIDSAFVIVVNANDFFGYACADSTSIDQVDLSWVLPIMRKYPNSGLDACLAFIRKLTPIDPWVTEEYKLAYQELVELNPNIWSEESN